MQNDVSETEEFLAVRRKNEELRESAESMLKLFYKDRKPEEGYAVIIKKVGPAGHFYITMQKNGPETRIVKKEEMEKAQHELQKEKEEFDQFTQFMKDRYFKSKDS